MLTLVESSGVLSEDQFWNCIFILLYNFHAVNRKIFSCVINEVLKISEGIENIRNTSVQELCGIPAEEVNRRHISGEKEMQEALLQANKRTDMQTQGFLMRYTLLPKKHQQQNIEGIVLIDFQAPTYTCHYCNVKEHTFDDFSVQFRNGKIVTEILTQRDLKASAGWAKNTLMPKLWKWAFNANANATATAPKSLQLIDTEKYCNLYKELKCKYASQVLEYWNKAEESTDPLKFIYEDLAIAAYLISLWRYPSMGATTRSLPTAFADLGCGNGLLVYILHEEGYQGYGYDVRARKIWSLYPQRTKKQLIEQVIEPSSFHLPPEVDWLIGNHSDELSPWLPVLAATAHLRMCYFLLPCCAYELSGAKFQRRKSTLSSYRDFYLYAKYISELCGYETLEDRLKIPSTKRLALVGYKRTHAPVAYEVKRQQIQLFVDKEIAEYKENSTTTPVKLRQKEELVRNCTQIDRNIIDELVETIFKFLLTSARSDEQQWRAGGRLSMREIVKNLTQENLRNIKNECGGIKTLLRNKHEIFEFCGNDVIGIRKPKPRDMLVKLKAGKKLSSNVKKRVCFFKQHHPDGCPLSDEQCSFIH